MVSSGKTKYIIVNLIIALTLLSCPSSEPALGIKPFSHLISPLVVQFKSGENDKPTHIGVIDLEKMALFNSIKINSFKGESNSRGVYSPFSRAYYFFHSNSSFLYSLKENGTLSEKIESWPYPGAILKTCTKEGYLIIGHHLGASQGTRISIFDTKINRFIREKLFLPVPNLWNTAFYDEYSDSCFFNSTVKDENNNTKEVLYKLDLDNFSIKEVFHSELNTEIADMFVKNQIYIAAYNSEDHHEAHLIWLDLSTGETIKHLDIHSDTGSFVIKKVFSYDNTFYTVVEKKPLNGSSAAMLYLYTYNLESDKLLPVWSDTTIPSFDWDESIHKNNLLYFITYSSPEIIVRVLDLDSIEIKDSKVFAIE